MSSTKRRKLDAQVPPQSAAVSAISALAARRRLASNPPPTEPSSSPEPEDPAPARTNAFSVLQSLGPKNKNGGSKVRPAKKGPRAAPHKPEPRSSQKPSTDSEATTPGGSSTAPRISYSSFALSKSNSRRTSTGAIQLRLRDGERFLVLGSYGIKVLTGQVTIAGASLRPSDQIHWVHAPHCYAVPVLRTVDKSSLELHSDPSSQGLRKLERLSPLFKRLWNEAPSPADDARLGVGNTFQIVCTSDDVPDKKGVVPELSSPPEWNKKLAALVSSASGGGGGGGGGGSSPSITLICGPKSSGKSTFSRLLANRLLTAADPVSQKPSHCGVAILDLDPGQPEFTPSGAVSLVHVTQPNLGVPFTHPSLDDPAFKIIRCHALASITPASAPEHYLECMLDLLATYHRTLKHCHLLINTPGWILGTGLDLLTEITSRVNPSEVIYMSEEGPAETVDSLRGATKKAFTTLPSQPSDSVSRTAIHLRIMSNMSYFHLHSHQTLSSGPAASRLMWNPASLATVRPTRVRYSGPQSGFLGIFSYDLQSPPHLLLDSINGIIVAAVDIEDPQAFRDLPRAPETMYPLPPASEGHCPPPTKERGIAVSKSPEGIPYIPNASGMTLDPRHSCTIGLVLVRGIDLSTNTLQILTPIPPRRIQEIKSQGRDILLVHGKFDTPTWAYTEDFYERSSQDEAVDKPADNDSLSTKDEDSDEDDDINTPDAVVPAAPVCSNADSPWVEVLQGNEKRPIGSRTWRVRRDLGRSQGD
ncbi:Polynucleotide 5'-hydroxyl-kinase GRC3 [Escovopsis weberi]|uniref:Polynucleotide 5'-hydroxyl-kinase GRC3 n=1 Tax=Escovopsis weberi TaxID=150374 RepID=A0A0M8N190_ESCWE|nr:Polynucleotide 5'-hydroxyl-kinase GRC3 [Escovopsis weberi]